MSVINIHKFAQELELEILLDGNKCEIEVESADITRPGLQLAGFYDYFDSNRILIFGKAETAFLKKLNSEERATIFNKLFAYPIPCCILSKNLDPFPEMLEYAQKYERVILRANKYYTSMLEHTMINYLSAELAPCMTKHGVLMDIYGYGVLLTGDSGIGKSETALELVKRGHRLVADDAVIIKKVSDTRLVGEAPEMIRYLMEIRGVGIIDIPMMYGIGSVIKTKSVDVVIKLEFWNESKQYDRLGLNEEFTEIMGVNVKMLTVPVRPGRNLSIIIEVAARNFRLKATGFNAAQQLQDRIQQQFGDDNAL